MGQIKKITSNKGITMLTLTITIVLMLILSFTISINVKPYVERKKKNNLETDIIKLKEEISHYYMENKTIPIVNKYINTHMLEKNINDNENYYVIDLSKMSKLNLNYGKDFEKITDYSTQISDLLDIYIINEQSHTIYYPKGIEYDGTTYYTTMNLDSIKIEDITIEGIQITGKNKGKINTQIQLLATVTPIFVANTGVDWTSSDEELATVDENGKVILKALGTVIITATSKDIDTITATYEIQIVKSELEQIMDEGKYVSVKTKVEDTDGNIITIPRGFKISEDSGKNVTEGIVIEDNDIIEGIGNGRGNQYVWIPVGTGIKKSDGTRVDITLGRYIFADGSTHTAEDETTILAKGTPILVQDIDDYENETQLKVLETSKYEYKELITKRDGVLSSGLDGENATALSIENFKASVEENGGYYIARYEATYGIDGKANSKISNTFGETIPTKEGTLWNKITQIDSIVACRDLYEGATTDLTNSYTWDTAIVYIQKFSGYEDYSYQTSKNGNLANTGQNNDEVCKINDMASNTFEWTTEYCIFNSDTIATPCTVRGGDYSNSESTTNRRGSSDSITNYMYGTFRPILYM